MMYTTKQLANLSMRRLTEHKKEVNKIRAAAEYNFKESNSEADYKRLREVQTYQSLVSTTYDTRKKIEAL